MALASNALPFGLRQVRLTPIAADGSATTASSILLPASRTFSFSETEDFERLEGDDQVVASHGTGPIVEWELEAGGISIAVWKILAGGTATASGTTPAAVNTYTKLGTDQRPYFQVEGRAISDNGGDFGCKVFRCKADGDLELEFSNGSWVLTSASGTGYPNLSDGKLYSFIHNETVTALTAGS